LTETELLGLLETHDALVRDCVTGRISLDEFLRRYNDFPFAYALDGHESAPDEKQMLGRHARRIDFHLGVMRSLAGLCSQEDAQNPLYIKAGRFPPSVAIQRLKAFADEYAQSDG
jgi:hypothetical protein